MNDDKTVTVTRDDRPSISQLINELECTQEGCWNGAADRALVAHPVLLEIAAAALAYTSSDGSIGDLLDAVDKVRK